MATRNATSKFDQPTPTKATADVEEAVLDLFSNPNVDVIRTSPSKSGRTYFKATVTLSNGRSLYLSMDTEDRARSKAIASLVKAGFTQAQAERMLEAAEE